MVFILTRIRVPVGFLLAGLYFYLAQPIWPIWLFGSGLAFLGILLRAWAAGHVRKNDQLAVTGPYALTRHPLYLGSFVIGIGFSLAGWSLSILVVFLLCFLLLYGPVMRAEEEHLRHLFARQYPDYQRRVPVLFPDPVAEECERGCFQSRALLAQSRISGCPGICLRPGAAGLGRSPETLDPQSGVHSTASTRDRFVQQTRGSLMTGSLSQCRPSRESPAGRGASKRLPSGSPRPGDSAFRSH